MSIMSDIQLALKNSSEALRKVESLFSWDPTATSLPVLQMNGDISAMNKDVEAELNYIYGERTGTLTCKWQGSSSLAYPKKNYTIKFDTEFEAKEGWGVQKKYCLKANYIDASHARNIVCAKLWGEMVRTRSGADYRLTGRPNGGAIDGFPVLVYINNEYMGLYTWNIPKDAWMLGMSSYSDTYTKSEAKDRFSTIVSGSLYYLKNITVGTTTRSDITTITAANSYTLLIGLGDATSITYPSRKLNGQASRGAFMTDKDDVVVWFDGSAENTDVAYKTVEIPENAMNMYIGFDKTIEATDWTVTLERNAKEAFICAEDHTDATRFFSEALVDGSDFELEYAAGESDSSWVLDSVNTLINACINFESREVLEQYVDIQSAIDYLIFTLFVEGTDIYSKNYILGTYDGIKWFFSAYDLDTTFGNHWTGKSYNSHETLPYIELILQHKLLMIVGMTYRNEVVARYNELRKTVLSEGNLLYHLTNFTCAIPQAAYDTESVIWPQIPGTASSNISQIMNHMRLRLAWLDKDINGNVLTLTDTVTRTDYKLEVTNGDLMMSEV